jgi:two-component system, NarL family, nitrate/nitrite response regulator NarL
VVIEGIQSWINRDPHHRVTLVGSGADLDDVVHGVGAAADVLLIDLNLHGRLVLDRVGELTAAGRNVVVFSAHSEPENVLAVLDAGAEFLDKDESREHCVETIVAVACNRPYVTPTSAGAMLSDSRSQRPALSEKERTALLMWFQGMTKSSVATRMGISEATVKQYIDRARAKYAAVGRRAPTKDALLARAIEDQLIRLDELRQYESFASMVPATSLDRHQTPPAR